MFSCFLAERASMNAYMSLLRRALAGAVVVVSGSAVDVENSGRSFVDEPAYVVGLLMGKFVQVA